MNQLDAMRMFAKVAESLSFAAAAKQLGVSSAVVTRGIATLEAHLNTRLLNRTKRRISLTEAGQAYLQGCTELITQLNMLDASVSSATQESVGSLKIAASEFFAATYLSDLLTAYHAAEPGVRFEMTVFASTQDLDGNDHDVWFSAERRLRDSSLICRPLTQCRDVIVASPTYLARRGPPEVPQNLPDHNVLLASNVATRHWEFRDAHGPRRVAVHPIFTSPNLMAVKRAALAGLGVARLPRPLIESQLRAGALKLLLDCFDLEGDERTMWMLYSGRRYITQRVRSFVDFVVARYREPQIF
ncbi:LysR family transcriptional regulator [Paraburkholderia madseniana]|uniref:LysR family transcriptional regulator n=3 Tax=Burkholderiaceae TaxID=119060 RepID=A0A6N6W184_9BURK|nr:LysR family transcriptional regulator [Paraburkholderia madseniana]